MNSDFSLFVSNHQQQQGLCLILQFKEPKLAESEHEMTKSMKNQNIIMNLFEYIYRHTQKLINSVTSKKKKKKLINSVTLFIFKYLVDKIYKIT